MMNNNQQTLLFDGINEDAYLSEEEESKVVSFALKTMEDNNMSFEEEEIYIKKFPALRMFANAYRRLLGEEEYRNLEQDNIKKIETRAWENE